jgi:NADPH:quinone reductase-like Zn-dependent oxidoreductase
MTTSVAMVMAGPGAPLEAVERSVPEPGPTEAIVRVHASSLNYHDMVNLMGFISGPWPRVPMTDGAGEVVAIGKAVDGISVGDRVFGAFHPEWLDGPPTLQAKSTPGDSGDGWLRQHVAFEASALILVPEHLSDVEAASLPCAGTTAWSSLRAGSIGPGDVVVTLGTGGVSAFAVQLAVALGATVIVTSSSDEKLQAFRTLGAGHCINYVTHPDWDVEVKRITHGRGADLVLDTGGEGTLGRSVKAARMAGTIAVVGVLSGFGNAEIPVSVTMLNNLHLVGITVGSVAAHRELADIVAEHGIRPLMDRVIDWEAVGEGVQVMQGGGHVGKIGIAIS